MTTTTTTTPAKAHFDLGKVARWHRYTSCERAMSPHPWRPLHVFQLALATRMIKVLSRHLANGGTVIEHLPGGDNDWRLGMGRFVAPYDTDPKHVATHITRRVLGFGWGVSMTTTEQE